MKKLKLPSKSRNFLAKAKSLSKTKQCQLCRLPINITKDDYCQLIDYFKGKFSGEGFYHTKCYTERLRGTEESKALRSAAWKILGKVQKLTGGEEKEEYVIVNSTNSTTQNNSLVQRGFA